MSLIIEALKKKRQGRSLTPEDVPVKTAEKENLRIVATPARLLPRHFLTLGSTSILLVAGAGWYIATAGSNTLLRANPVLSVTAPVAVVTEAATPAPVLIEPEVKCLPPAQATPVVEAAQTLLLKTEVPELPVDALLNQAYLAWRNGKLEEAEKLYQAMLQKDDRNLDALLGLAAIAQKRGDNLQATQQYQRVLAQDPRNSTANAGIAALNPDEHSETRLKMLLRLQGNSAPLNFALGNLYAEQQRWSEAQQAYFNAYMLEPGNTEYAYNLAVSQDHIGQKKLASQYYFRAIQLDDAFAAGFDHAQISQHAQELAQ